MNLADVVPCIHCGNEDHSGAMHIEMFGPPTPESVPVKGSVTVEEAVRTNEEAADYGAYSTYLITATDTAPVQILGHDDNRARAVVWIDGTTNSVWIGKKEQVFATGGAQGALLSSGQRIEIRNKQPLFYVPNGVACNLSVINERWERKS
jgi:hypothetical protein